jgi:hypothetical protein
MRISVCNWQTSDDDIDRTIACVRRVLVRRSAPNYQPSPIRR